MSYISPKISNLKTYTYTIGVNGITGCDYNFTNPANTSTQGIQLGGMKIIPDNCTVLNMLAICTSSITAGTMQINLGFTSGASEYIAVNLTNVNDAATFVQVANSSQVLASNVYFSGLPSSNWNTLITGEWKIYITFIDNS